jgi:Tol biopolymer transport system component
MVGSPAISPDQRTAAVRINAGSGSTSDIWLQDLERDVISRFTFGPGTKQNPVWSPDGSRVALSIQTLRTRTYDIYQKPASGSGQEELLLHAGGNGRSEDWSPDGKWIVYAQTSQTLTDLWLVPLEGERKPIPYLQTQFDERSARFWPGSGAPRWMAYQSNESGQSQIYVQAIPASGGKYQVSTSGGTQPAWRRDGKELYFLSTDQTLMAVPITVGTSVAPGTPQPLFASDIAGYAPSADGQRFLVNVPADGQAPAASPITVVLNWTAGLRR